MQKRGRISWLFLIWFGTGEFYAACTLWKWIFALQAWRTYFFLLSLSHTHSHNHLINGKWHDWGRLLSCVCDGGVCMCVQSSLNQKSSFTLPPSHLAHLHPQLNYCSKNTQLERTKEREMVNRRRRLKVKKDRIKKEERQAKIKKRKMRNCWGDERERGGKAEEIKMRRYKTSWGYENEEAEGQAEEIKKINRRRKRTKVWADEKDKEEGKAEEMKKIKEKERLRRCKR